MVEKTRDRKGACEGCSKSPITIAASRGGKRYCLTCYQRLCPQVRCVKCGRLHRVSAGDERVPCLSCRKAARHCLKCEAPTASAAKVFEDGEVLCANCRSVKRTSGICPNCGRHSKRLCRDYKGGFEIPVCEHCRRISFETCYGCGKNRRAVSYTVHGHPLCTRCAAQNGKPFVCPECGQKSRYHTLHRCQNCYWREKCLVFIVELRATLKSGWLRDEIVHFAEHMSVYKDKHFAHKRLLRYRPFFLELDKHFPTRDDLSYGALAHQFYRRRLRSYSFILGYLAKRGFLPRLTAHEWKRYVAEQINLRMIEVTKGKWYETIVSDYYNYNLQRQQNFERRGWIGEHSKMEARTVTSRLRAATAFLSTLQPRPASDIRSITQSDIDSFLHNRPGYRYSLRHFVTYLNRVVKYFAPLSVPIISRKDKLEHLGAEHSKVLLAKWMAAEGEDCRTALIGTLMLLYAQTVAHIVGIKLSDIQEERGGTYNILIGRSEIVLFGTAAGLLRRYLEVRVAVAKVENARENIFLFPGRLPGFHLAEPTVHKYLRAYGVTCSELYTTAILNCYLNGVDHPNVLVKSLGLCRETALRYFVLLEPEIADEIAEVARP